MEIWKALTAKIPLDSEECWVWREGAVKGKESVSKKAERGSGEKRNSWGTEWITSFVYASSYWKLWGGSFTWGRCSGMKVYLPVYCFFLCPKKFFTLSGHENAYVDIEVMIVRWHVLSESVDSLEQNGGWFYWDVPVHQWFLSRVSCMYSRHYLVTHQLKPEESTKILHRSFSICPSDASYSWKAELAPLLLFEWHLFFFLLLSALYLPKQISANPSWTHSVGRLLF